MSFLDRLFAIGAIRNTIWRMWYPFLTRRLRTDEVVFLNYGFETDPPVGLPLSPDDEPDRACIPLCRHAQISEASTGAACRE